MALMKRSTSGWFDDDDTDLGDEDESEDGPEDAAEDDSEEDADFAPAFATGSSPRPSSQEAKDVDPTFPTQLDPPDEPGQSLLSTHPIILRDIPPQADARPSQTQLSRLHRSLTQRDLVILQFLFDYRYLNTLQVKELFFPSLRSCQMRLHHLKNLGLIYVWKVIETPGVRRRHSLCLISARGARVLADWHGDDPRVYVERSHDARDHCWHALHDLEANQFFVALIMRSRPLPGEGLLLWHGEEQVRAERRQTARQYKWPVPTPDGCGVYLANGGRILFDLEWDRATESMDRIRQKIASYVGYFEHFRNAEQHHVLFVVPTDDREDKLLYAIWQGRPNLGSDNCCSFWTTTSDRLRWWGPLGGIWLQVKNRASEPPPLSVTRLSRRHRFKRLPPMQTNERDVADCLGKASWWARRPGGGQVA
jgi:protein involved in plasmid replication-relaxation